MVIFMSIMFDCEKKYFCLNTNNTSYIMGIAADGILTHIYYGAKIGGTLNFNGIYSDFITKSFCPNYDRDFFDIHMGAIYREYPEYCGSDYRNCAIKVKYPDGSRVTRLLYKGHEIINGKPNLCGLPCTYVEDNSKAETLKIVLKDLYSDLYVELLYTVIDGIDAIMRSSRIINKSDNNIILDTALSASIDCFNEGFDMTYFTGAWGRERHIKRQSVPQGVFSLDSKRGATGHDSNPFVALSEKNADENKGNVLGINLIYSGDFEVGIQSDEDSLRAYIGINPYDFSWVLLPNESFQTPEAVFVYSSNGFGEMSRTFHKLYRNNLCRGMYRDSIRPVLINNWEATYFDFDEKKIVALASKAAECGIELMVLDDGWFGTRNGESGSLGDWTPNLTKLPEGLKGLAEKIEKLGMKFGIWMEPEMVSPDSYLYRNHPEWCLHEKGKLKSEGRNQYILDLSRQEVCDYVLNSVRNVLRSANISYLKWDMNRNMSEVGSAGFDGLHQGEVRHRYILGLYGILEKLTSEFPDVLFEGCSGGGGRFDPGMLFYMPQIWTSDDTDAVERLYIQYGTSFVYPSSTMGAHVSAVPNHQTGRLTPFDMRGKVAMCGRFGYELNLFELSDDEIKAVKQQVCNYKEIEQVIHKGDLYRLASPFENEYTSFEFISPEKDKIILFYFNIKCFPCVSPRVVKLCGLDEKSQYRNTQTGEVYTGDILMNMGMLFERNKDCISQMLIFEKI